MITELTFENRNFSFSSGVNIFIGESSSGKSMLLRSIVNYDKEHLGRKLYVDNNINVAYSFNLGVETGNSDRKKELLQILLNAFGENAKITSIGNKVFLKTDNGEWDNDTFPESIKAFINLYRLVESNVLNTDTILIMDNPTTGLSTKFIKILSDFIIKLTEWGVQVFIATHDYLLSHRLSLFVEAEKVNKEKVKFWGLTKTNDGIEVEEANELAELTNNSIVNSFSEYYDEEYIVSSNKLRKEREQNG